MKTLKDIKVDNKKVVLRCDLNVTIKNGKIIDDTKIIKSLKTIKYLLDNNAKVLIMSHLGKIKTEKDKKDNDMKIVYKRLKKYIKDISFIDETKGSLLEKKFNSLKYGKALLIQNTRYEDLNDKKESSCDEDLSKYWASLGEIFINDAFGSIHRGHASNYGISKYLPSYAGFLIEEEINALNKLDNPEKPFVLIMGGSKVSDKIKVIEKLSTKADYILIGGAMVFPFLRAKGLNIGSSICEEKDIEYAKDILKKYKDKIVLPVDFWGLYEDDLNHDPILEESTEIDLGYIALDIGEDTVNHFKNLLQNAKTVFWNGPVGKYEDQRFIYGTELILKYLINKKIKTVLGGGDIVSCATILGLSDKVAFTSTGGGATLKYLEDHNQPGLENLK